MLQDILIGSTVLLALSQTVTGVIVSNKNKDIDLLEIQLGVAKANNKALATSLEIQNNAIQKLKADYDTSVIEYENREPARVYVDRWHTKYVDRNITGDCNEILNSIKHGYF